MFSKILGDSMTASEIHIYFYAWRQVVMNRKI